MEIPQAYIGNEPYIFLSYSHADEEAALKILSDLNKIGYRVWYDDGITPGTEWDINIARHIKECSFFIALISDNYLNSSNCRDELNYVRDLDKPRLLIYLENVELPDEMQMRLGRLQALFLYKYKGREDRFYDKLSLTPELGICRAEPPKEVPTVSVKEEISSETSSNNAGGNTTPNNENKSDVSPPTSPKSESSKKFLIIGIIAVIVIIAIIGLVVKGGLKDNTDTGDIDTVEPTETVIDDTSEEPTETTDDASSGAPVTAIGGKNIMLGEHKSNSDYSSFSSLQELDNLGETYELYLLPFYVNAGYSKTDDICLGFYDEKGFTYYYYGKYTLKDGILKVVPGGKGKDLSEEAVPLADELKYEVVALNSDITLSSNDESVFLSNVVTKDGKTILKGTLSEGCEAFNEIESLDLEYLPDKNEVVKCEIGLTDGRTAGDISCSVLNLGDEKISISWSSVTYTKNGQTITDDVYTTVPMYLTVINNYPYGFTITDGSECYYYQN